MVGITNEELVNLYQKGDQEALETLVINNKGIVLQIASKYYTDKTSSFDEEDLNQEGYIGLITAANKYNPNKDNPANFITYAIYWIRQKISRFVTQKNTNEEVSLNKPYSEEGDIELMDIIQGDDPYPTIVNNIYIMQLRKELEDNMRCHNTLMEIEILKLKYGWDNNKKMSDQEIGKLFNVTSQNINERRHNGLNKLRNSKWGNKMASEIYAEKIKYIENIDQAINRIEFERKHLYLEEKFMEEMKNTIQSGLYDISYNVF